MQCPAAEAASAVTAFGGTYSHRIYITPASDFGTLYNSAEEVSRGFRQHIFAHAHQLPFPARKQNVGRYVTRSLHHQASNLPSGKYKHTLQNPVYAQGNQTKKLRSNTRNPQNARHSAARIMVNAHSSKCDGMSRPLPGSELKIMSSIMSAQPFAKRPTRTVTP